MLADVEAAHGMPWMALRYFNACGAHEDGDLGFAILLPQRHVGADVELALFDPATGALISTQIG